MHHDNFDCPCKSVSFLRVFFTRIQIAFNFSSFKFQFKLLLKPSNFRALGLNPDQRRACCVRRMFSGILLSPFLLFVYFVFKRLQRRLTGGTKTNRLQLETRRKSRHQRGQGVRRVGGRMGEERTCVLPTLTQLFSSLKKAFKATKSRKKSH